MQYDHHDTCGESRSVTSRHGRRIISLDSTSSHFWQTNHLSPFPLKNIVRAHLKSSKYVHTKSLACAVWSLCYLLRIYLWHPIHSTLPPTSGNKIIFPLPPPPKSKRHLKSSKYVHAKSLAHAVWSPGQWRTQDFFKGGVMIAWAYVKVKNEA